MREAIIPVVAPFFGGSFKTVYDWLGDERKDTALIPTLNVTLRYLLQTIGTEWGRKLIHPDIWTEHAKERASMLRDFKTTVIDDLRFENEYAMLRKEGALLFKIVRPDAPTTGNAGHASEARLEGLEFDEVIINDGTEVELRTQIDDLMFDYYGL
ncbi:hypothetical protein HL667_06330 [Bradyrhizobium sp. 83012]|uniref:Uncharacterized protein n=1 Tax=Bradyrhizobium aeschynomenes TaxID=2734909 RepID=A0ABX2C8L1_9BRAD|nr:hypothetical protein [Bradyrhizobium aeschynomenes]NPU64609.1 hypothetical protein [Bradyrhizobium aeschynomenes]